eukprot:gene5683-11469_t
MEIVPDLLTKITVDKGQDRIDACQAISDIAYDTDHRRSMLAANITLIPVLLNVINDDTGDARVSALEAILNIALETSNVIPMTAAELGLLPLLVTVINEDQGEARLNAILVTTNLALEEKVVPRMSSDDLGLLSAFVKMMVTGNEEESLHSCATLWNMSSVKEAIIHIVAPDLHLLDALITIIKEKSGAIIGKASGVLNNICYYADYHIANLLLQSQIHISMLDILKQGGPVPSEWKSKGDHISEMLRCLMKLSRQSCAAEALKAAGAVDVITPLLTDTSSDGLKALFLLVFLIGKDEVSTTSESESLLHAQPHALTLLIEVLGNTLNLKETEQYDLSTFGLNVILSACLSLAISDSNKAILVKTPLLTHLITALDQFVNNKGQLIIELANSGNRNAGGGGDDVESASLVIEVMLQLSFAFDSDEDLQLHYMPHSLGIEMLLRGACNLPSDRTVCLDDSAMCSANRLLRRLTSTSTPVVPVPVSDSNGSNGSDVSPPVTTISADTTTATSTTTGTVTTTTTPSLSTHVMLSYSWSVRKDLVTAFGKVLREKGYEVWRDEEGSALVPNCREDTMSAAVEHSYAVVIFVSLAYKQSANCRMEAKYCNQRYNRGHLKQIIYVMMDPNYHTRSSPQQVDGWLGFMIGDSLWYPMYSEQDVSSTVMSVVNLLGANALKSRSYLTSSTVKVPNNNTPLSIPSISTMQPLMSVPNHTDSESVSKSVPPEIISLKPDYNLAWEYLTDKSKHKTPERIVSLLDELGLSKATELMYVEPGEVQALAACMKPVAKKAFKIAMKGQWKDEA